MNTDNEKEKMDMIRRMYYFLTGSKEYDDENLYEAPLTFAETVKYLEPDVNKEIEPIQKDTPVIADNKCFEASGKVTHVDTHYGIIDKNLYFETYNLSKIDVGMTLQYLAYKIDGEIKISKILFEKKDDWNEEVLTEPRNIVKCRPVFKVIDRNERIVKLMNGYEIDLNKVESEFVPMIGDFLGVDSLVEEDENSVNKCGRILNVSRIYPVKYNMLQGNIVAFNRETEMGQINKDILFTKDVCAPGYVPAINDRIQTEVIECDVEHYKWRSLKVAPYGHSINKYYTIVDNVDKELLKDKNEICLQEHISVHLQKIGDKQMITVSLANNGTLPQTLVDIQFKSSSHKTQLTVEWPKLHNSVMLKTTQSVYLKILCEAKFMGTTKELMILFFNGFKIGRYVKISVIPQYKINPTNREWNRYGKNLAAAAWKSFQNANTKEIIPGQRPVKPPSFISNKLPSYEIPENFAKTVFNIMAQNKMNELPINTIAPCLGNSLEYVNYTDVFHYLLYLEEISVQVNIRKYDIALSSFIKDGEFMMLEVPDLMERRPSVIIGDKVLAYDPRNIHAKPLEGHVHKTGKCHLYLKFNANFHHIYKGEDYSIEFHSSRSNFRRYHQSIDLASRNLGKKILFPTCVTPKTPQISFVCEDEDELFQQESIENGNTDNTTTAKYIKNAGKCLNKNENMNKLIEETKTYLNHNSSNKPENLNKLTNSMRTLLSSNRSQRLEWFDKKLNNFQKAAVKNILLGVARPLPYFIFGPPGTGKTVTIIETILQILRMIPNSRLLVCAPSNSAADLLALRLLDSKILQPGDLVRMVAYRCIMEGSIPEKLLPYCVTGDLAREGSRESRTIVQNGVNTNLQASVLGRHRITVGTCMVISVLYAMGFTKGHFTHILVDEAGQATEPELMIPLSMLDIKNSQCILAGDPMQLGPCVFSMISKEYGLGDSYFERIINRFPYHRDAIGFPESGGFDPRLVTRLVYNYRSLPELLTCPNNLFYQNELRPTISETDSEEAKLLMRVSSVLPARVGKLPPALIFHGVRGQNYQTADCPSWFNPVEAGQIFFYLTDLYKLGIKANDVGVITPYIRQGQQVRDLLIDNNMSLPKIGSVEEFQGQEFKIVILSCVRSNEIDAQNDSKYGLGFIASPRRLNVAISRAQALLIIIGNPHLLILDKYWRNVLIFAKEIGGYTGCDLPSILTT